MESSLQQAIQNPVILERIFEQCSIKILKHCRLVSKQWYNLSLEQWRSRAILRLGCVDEKIPLQYHQVFGNPHKRLEQPFTSMMKFETRPYRRLRIVGRAFSCVIEDTYLITFLAPHLHELYLNAPIDTDYWNELIFELTPNLKKLVDHFGEGFTDLEYCAVREQHNLKRVEFEECKFYFHPVTWQVFLSTFTKLEIIVFKVSDSYTKFHTPFTEFLKAVKKVKSQNPDNLPIHHLDVISRFFRGDKFIPESIPRLLEDVKFPLKTLKIDVGKDTVKSIFQRLVNNYCETLATLVIMRGDKDRSHQSRGPCYLNPFTEQMRSLKNLEIFGPILKDMNSLQYTPNLENLSICEASFYEFSPRFGDSKDLSVFPSSTQMVDEVRVDFKLSKLLEFNAYFSLGQASTVKILKRWMPHLERLRVRVTPGDGFGEICRQWGDTLQKLVLGWKSFLVDEDITGLGIGEDNGEDRAPNVTFLKKLQVFRMEEYICSREKPRRRHILQSGESDFDEGDSDTEDDDDTREDECVTKFPKITDPSIHGFLELPFLHTLELQSTESMELETRSLLKAKGVDVTLRIRTACTCPRPLTGEEMNALWSRIRRY